MVSLFIEDLSLDVPRVEDAIDAIHTQMLTATDLNGQQILQSAELLLNTQKSLFKADTPYAVTRIVDITNDNNLNELVIDRKEYECVTDVIFKARPESDVQRLGNRLADKLWLVLQPSDTPLNPGGFDLPIPRWWDFVHDVNFKNKLRRTVTQVPDVPKELTGSYYSVPLQYKIEVYPFQPLS